MGIGCGYCFFSDFDRCVFDMLGSVDGRIEVGCFFLYRGLFFFSVCIFWVVF